MQSCRCSHNQPILAGLKFGAAGLVFTGTTATRMTQGSPPQLSASDEGEHRLGWHLGRVQHATGIAEDAKLDGEAEPIAATPPGTDNGEIGGVEHVVARHRGRVGWDRPASPPAAV
jgi:hypothetical protein